MDIILKDVSIVCFRSNVDTLLITPSNVKNGIWPFTGHHLFKTELPLYHAEKWLEENFGPGFKVKIIDSKLGEIE